MKYVFTQDARIQSGVVALDQDDHDRLRKLETNIKRHALLGHINFHSVNRSPNAVADVVKYIEMMDNKSKT